jgi:hypothetical protein
MVWMVLLVLVAAMWPMWGWLAATIFMFMWLAQRRRTNYYINQADLRGYAQEAVQLELQRGAVSHLVVERAKLELLHGR